jgi:hypothetical protein
LALHSIRTTDPGAFTKRNVQTKNKTQKNKTKKKLAEIEANLHAKTRRYLFNFLPAVIIFFEIELKSIKNVLKTKDSKLRTFYVTF